MADIPNKLEIAKQRKEQRVQEYERKKQEKMEDIERKKESINNEKTKSQKKRAEIDEIRKKQNVLFKTVNNNDNNNNEDNMGGS